MSIWYPSENVDAQAAHVGWGAFIILAASLFWGIWVGIAILAGWIAFKEFGFDLIIEQDSISDSAMDAAFYVVGGVVGAITFWLTL